MKRLISTVCVLIHEYKEALNVKRSKLVRTGCGSSLIHKDHCLSRVISERNFHLQHFRFKYLSYLTIILQRG